MKIVGLEGAQVFLDEGGTQSDFYMVVEKNGENYRVPVVYETYQMLSEIGSVAPSGGSTEQTMMEWLNQNTAAQSEPEPPPPPVQAQVEQEVLVGELQSEQPEDASMIEKLAKVGLFGKPEDVVSVIGGKTSPIGTDDGPDVIESFDDTSTEDDDDEEEEEEETEQW